MDTARHFYGSNPPEYGPDVVWGRLRFIMRSLGRGAGASSTQLGRTTTSSPSARDAIVSLMAAKHGIEALSLTGLLLVGHMDRYIEGRMNTYRANTQENPDD